MGPYIQYIQDKDKKIIFHPKYEAQVIKTVLGETKGYQQIKAENENEESLPVIWVTDDDLELAKFSFQMFVRSKKIMLTDISQEEFLILWDNYTRTPDYFIQVTNYMLNSDDYTSGARIQLQTDEDKTVDFPKGNLPQNMKNLQSSFQGQPEKESQYVQNVASIGTELFHIFQQE